MLPLIGALALGVAAAYYYVPKLLANPEESNFQYGMAEEHLNIVYSATDPDKVEEFYGYILGLEHERPNYLVKLGEYGYYHSYRAGSSELKFIIATDKEKLAKIESDNQDAIGLRFMTIPMKSTDKAAVIQRLKEKGFDEPKFESSLKEGKLSESCMVKDLDGNPVELLFLPEDANEQSKKKVTMRVNVSDKADVKKYFTKVIGMTDNGEFKANDGTTILDCYTFGDSEVHVKETSNSKVSTTGGPFEQYGPCLIQLFVGDVLKAREIMVERNAKIHTEPFFLGRIPHVMFVESPVDGIKVEFGGVKYYSKFTWRFVKRQYDEPMNEKQKKE